MSNKVDDETVSVVSNGSDENADSDQEDEEDELQDRPNFRSLLRGGSTKLRQTQLLSDDKARAAALAEHYAAVSQAVSEQRRIPKSKMCIAELDRITGTITVTTIKGLYMKSMGKTVRGVTTLLPEEALFLMDIGALETHLNGIRMSLQQAFATFIHFSDHYCQNPCSLHISHTRYQVYAYLKRLGFIVFRHDASQRSRSKRQPDPCDSQNDGGGYLGAIYSYLKRIYHTIAVSSSTNPDSNSLVDLSKCSSMELQTIVPPVDISLYLDDHRSEGSNIVLLDVYKPEKLAEFKKSERGTPDYRVLCVNSRDPFPTPPELAWLHSIEPRAPLKVAMVESANVGFLSLEID
eukprot:jgi/Hompol1/1560/HPOL_003422-RA